MKKMINSCPTGGNFPVSRRHFLTAVLLSGSVGVAASAQVATPPSPVAAVQKHQGYQETAHVRRYYDSARCI